MENASVSENTPLVSVIIPTKNRSELLLEAVESVRKQDYPAVEIIVVDDGSSEADFEHIMSSLGPLQNVEVLQTQGNTGSSAARNVGIDAAKGECITFLDDDDLMVQGKLAGQIGLMQSRSADFVSCTRYYYVVGDDQELRGSIVSEVKLTDMWFQNRIISVSPMGTAALIKKLKFDPVLTTGVDYDLWLRCLLECEKTVNYSQPAIYYRRFYGGATETGRRWRKFKGRMMILRKFRSYMPLHWQLYHMLVSMSKLIVPDPNFLFFRLKKTWLK